MFSFNSLLDTGIQRSYFLKLILKKLNYETNTSTGEDDAKTFLGSSWTIFLKILINNEFDIKFNFDSHGKVINGLKDLYYRPAGEF